MIKCSYPDQCVENDKLTQECLHFGWDFPAKVTQFALVSSL
jgi:hypothetical protein